MTAESRTILHVGCGRAPLPAEFDRAQWREIRYDIDPAVQPDLVGSITDMAAVPDASVDALLSSHNLEHLHAREVPRALAEFLRVLRPGGVAWILVPDVQALAPRIADGDLDGELYRSPAGPIATADILWGHRVALAEGRHYMAHRTGFSAATLEQRLHEAGFAPLRVERREAAFELFATAHRPAADAEAPFERGRAAHAAGRWAEAEASYAQAIAQQPQHWPAHFERGVVCQLMGRADEAIAHVRRSIALQPGFARAHATLGAFFGMAGRSREAEASLTRAVALDPGVAQHHYNLGKALQDRGAHAEAEAAYRRALAIEPTHALAQVNLALALLEQGRVDAAEAQYRDALRCDPRNGLAQLGLGKLLYAQARGREGLRCYRAGIPLLSGAALHSSLPMTLNFADDVSDEEVAQAHREFDRRFIVPLIGSAAAPRNVPDPARRLRVGYLSRDFRRHSLRYFLLPILAHHDRAAFEVVCYHDSADADEVTAQYRAHTGVWVECRGLDDAALAERIRADAIDILVDLAGHTADNRLPVFARRPAPVSITYLGYPATTGVSAIDYRISDGCIDPEPPAAPIFSAEQPLRLAHGYFCYQPVEGTPEVGACAFERAGSITFGSLNQGAKLNPTLFAAWAEILRRVPGARLWLQNGVLHAPSARRSITEQFAALGIGDERLLLRPFDTPPGYLRAYHEIDIALDSFPYNGGTTTCEALWMGAPVVSRRGSRHVARLGASILHAVGLPELVADDAESYVAKGVAVAGDTARLRELRAGLRARMAASPLMDHAGFARELEGAYRGAWQRWCARSRP